jgi:hypothetical protein
MACPRFVGYFPAKHLSSTPEFQLAPEFLSVERACRSGTRFIEGHPSAGRKTNSKTPWQAQEGSGNIEWLLTKY